MWGEIPSFLDDTFPGWEFVAAEEMLYETIENKDLNFSSVSLKFSAFQSYYFVEPNING